MHLSERSTKSTGGAWGEGAPSAPFATRFFMLPFVVADNLTKKKSAKATSRRNSTPSNHTQSQVHLPTGSLHMHAIKHTAHAHTRIRICIFIHIHIHSCLVWGTANREPAASSAGSGA